jgi:hypothetical protein
MEALVGTIKEEEDDCSPPDPPPPTGASPSKSFLGNKHEQQLPCHF